VAIDEAKQINVDVKKIYINSWTRKAFLDSIHSTLSIHMIVPTYSTSQVFNQLLKLTPNTKHFLFVIITINNPNQQPDLTEAYFRLT
jgi:hypothetical protein